MPKKKYNYFICNLFAQIIELLVERGYSEYQITLTKDWGFTFGSTYVKSFWKYRVTKDSVTLIDKKDLDSLPMIIK